MAKVKIPEAPIPHTLRIGLHDPGMTPILRAGLGGLAAALRAIGPQALEPHGTAIINADAITLDWREPGKATAFCEALFAACFRLDAQGLIDLPGTYQGVQDTLIRAALTQALRLTFLQHGSSAGKDGKLRACAIEIDGETHHVGIQPYKDFTHQGMGAVIGECLDKPLAKRKPLQLAGWANPGAVERHVGLGCTDLDYQPSTALCACFTLVGCVSLQGYRGAGALIVPDPVDLPRFAGVRPHLTPQRLADCHVSSVGDGTLAIQVALRSAEWQEGGTGIANFAAMTLRATTWASQQKSRVDTFSCQRFSQADLIAFQHLTALCPPRILLTKPPKKGELGGYWAIPSNLRGFVADNLARGRPWYQGFAQARTLDDPPKWIHRFYSPKDDLGGLRFPDDRQGLIAMTATLDEAEGLFIASIHTALRQRFGAIASENQGAPAAFRNRLQGERDKWRLAFAGAKTHEQIRSSLADLWSRAGTVKELQTGYATILPLLKPDRWEVARDLALIALASYQGKGTDDAESTDTL